MNIENLDYTSIISYFNKFQCDYITWIFVGIQIYYFALNGYLLLSDRIKKHYYFIQNNDLNKILDKWRDYILLALLEQLYINSLKYISKCYLNFNQDFTKILVCVIYGFVRGLSSSYYDYVIIFLKIIFSFGILMIYYDFNELTRLHINMFVNTVYFIMYMFTYIAIYSHETIGTDESNNIKLSKSK